MASREYGVCGCGVPPPAGIIQVIESLAASHPLEGCSERQLSTVFS